MELKKLILMIVEQEPRQREIKGTEDGKGIQMTENVSKATIVIPNDAIANILVDHIEADILHSSQQACETLENETTEAGRLEQAQ